MNRYLLIAVGAALGANARYLISAWAAGRFGAGFPYGTFLINVTGSFALGLFVGLGETRLNISPELRLLIAVGLLGGYTTFSSFTVESLNLLRNGSLALGAANILGENVLGLGGALLGLYVARLLV